MDARSTVVGLKAQACPGGGWNGMPAELDGRATVLDCITHGACGCIYGDAVRHIEERLISACKGCGTPILSYELCTACADGNDPFFTSKYSG